jgi:hypothetical protein
MPKDTPTPTLSPTQTPSPLPTSPPTPTSIPTPTMIARCAASQCRTPCGWLDSYGSCHDSGMLPDGTRCCFSTCQAGSCVKVSGSSTDTCKTSQTCLQTVAGAVTYISPYPTQRPSTTGSSGSGSSSGSSGSTKPPVSQPSPTPPSGATLNPTLIAQEKARLAALTPVYSAPTRDPQLLKTGLPISPWLIAIPAAIIVLGIVL